MPQRCPNPNSWPGAPMSIEHELSELRRDLAEIKNLLLQKAPQPPPGTMTHIQLMAQREHQKNVASLTERRRRK